MAEMNEHELTDEERQQLELVTGNPEMLAGIVGDLSGASRRKRQTAAHVVAIVAEYRPEALDVHVPELLDALARPEAQTRWEILNALAMLVSTHAKEIGSVYEDAEDALFDEDSATLRLAAFRLLAVWGGTERRRSEKVWPILEEAIRCYHGDLEYRDMLGYLYEFAVGKIDGKVAAELAGRLAFDAESGKGAYIRARSSEIYEMLVKRFKLEKPKPRARVTKEDDDTNDEE